MLEEYSCTGTGSLVMLELLALPWADTGDKTCFLPRVDEFVPRSPRVNLLLTRQVSINFYGATVTYLVMLEPVIPKSGPETFILKPETNPKNTDPRNWKPKPEAQDPKPSSRNPKLNPRNPESAARNPKPETPISKSEIQNPKSEIRNPKPGT